MGACGPPCGAFRWFPAPRHSVSPFRMTDVPRVARAVPQIGFPIQLAHVAGEPVAHTSIRGFHVVDSANASRKAGKITHVGNGHTYTIAHDVV